VIENRHDSIHANSNYCVDHATFHIVPARKNQGLLIKIILCPTSAGFKCDVSGEKQEITSESAVLPSDKK